MSGSSAGPEKLRRAWRRLEWGPPGEEDDPDVARLGEEEDAPLESVPPVVGASPNENPGEGNGPGIGAGISRDVTAYMPPPTPPLADCRAPYCVRLGIVVC